MNNLQSRMTKVYNKNSSQWSPNY